MTGRAWLIVGLLVAAVPRNASAQTTSSPGSLDAARTAAAQAPDDLNALLWHGRFLGYTDYAAAVALYTNALRRWPDEPWLLRHRGHRYISLRQFDAARADLERAYVRTRGAPDVVEQDGQPNPSGIPTSTLQSNIRYHLALAQFLTDDFTAAARLWREDATVAANLDQRVAATYWWVLAMARAGDREGVAAALAPIRADWTIIENGSYHQLLLWMQGSISEETLRAAMTTPLDRHTIGNGIAQWQFTRGRSAEAAAALRETLQGPVSASFGYIAAERLAKTVGLK
jgi:tetratricopeptide (TPR) repeat protein